METGKIFLIVYAVVFVIKFNKFLGYHGNRRVDTIGDLTNTLTPFFAVNNAFVDFKMA